MSTALASGSLRNLVLCLDGTNNQFGTNNTNVVRLAQTLVQSPQLQRLYYDPGVGTLPEPGGRTELAKFASRVGALAFATDLPGKVQQAYTYLMDLWQPGDRVFLIGFSRGAYTARVLAAMLHQVGLLPPGNHNLVPYAWRLFRSLPSRPTHHETWTLKQKEYWDLCRAFRDSFAHPSPESDERHFATHFMGLWDTVSSMGWAWNPASFPWTAGNPSVRIVRHAIALDERRAFYRSNRLYPQTGQDFDQQWFAGVHSDVGGGYVEEKSGLWRPPFEWILNHAIAAELRVDPDRLKIVQTRTPHSKHSWNDPAADSMKWFWRPAEYFPKSHYDKTRKRRILHQNKYRPRTLHPKNDPKNDPENEDVLSVALLRRIRELDGYEPPNISRAFLERVRALPEINGPMAYA